MSLTADQSDKSTRLITVEECDKKINMALRNIKMLYDMENPKEQIAHQRATIKVWESVKYHIEHGVKLIIDDKGKFQRLETDKK